MPRTNFAITTVEDVAKLHDGGVAASPQRAAVLLAEHTGDLERANGFGQVTVDVTDCEEARMQARLLQRWLHALATTRPVALTNVGGASPASRAASCTYRSDELSATGADASASAADTLVEEAELEALRKNCSACACCCLLRLLRLGCCTIEVQPCPLKRCGSLAEGLQGW